MGDAPKEEEKKGDPQYDWIGEGMRAREEANKKMAKEDCDLPCQLKQKAKEIQEKKGGGPVKRVSAPEGLAAELAARRAGLGESDDED